LPNKGNPGGSGIGTASAMFVEDEAEKNKKTSCNLSESEASPNWRYLTNRPKLKC
jgi:hypothetical protein